MQILREIIDSKSEDFLYENDNRRTLWEIANCLKARSMVLRKVAENFTSYQEGRLVTPNGKENATLTYTDRAAEFYQSRFFTNDPEILIPLLMKALEIRDSTEGLDDTFGQIFEDRGLKEELFDDLRQGEFPRMREKTVITSHVYPILLENSTNLSFITGDECVPKTRMVLLPWVFYHFFPLDPELAIIFLDEKAEGQYFDRKVTRKDQIHRWNKLVHNCSTHYIFGRHDEALRMTVGGAVGNLAELV
jgi:hypothetical protein